MTINGFEILKEFILVVILFISLLSLCFLIYKKCKKKHKSGINNIDNLAPFEKEIFMQLMHQQFEKSFEAISDSLIQEYRKIYKMINNSKHEVNANAFLTDSDCNDKQMLPEKNENRHRPINTVPDSNLYDEALNLAASGFSSAKIAQMLHIPFGEIDLIMKLNSNEVSWNNMEMKRH